MVYNTKQKTEIIAYLKEKKGTPLSAGDIGRHLAEENVPVGKTTIYRQLENLAEEGVIARIAADGDRSAYYEYIDKADCYPHCFHCKCVKCGKLIHLECEELLEVTEHLSKEHGFTVDPVKTVIYGLCEACR